MLSAVPIGRVRRPHGLRGEVVVEDYAQGTYNPPLGQAITLRRGDLRKDTAVAGWRPAAAGIIARFEGCADRRTAELFRDCVVTVPRDDLPPLAEDEFYFFELVGLPVWDTEGHRVGVVTEVYAAAAADVLVVGREQGPPWEIPLVKAHVAAIRRGDRVEIYPYIRTP